MNLFKKIIILLGFLAVTSLIASTPAQGAVNVWGDSRADNPTASICVSQGAAADQNVNSIIKVITSTLLFILGVVAIIMIIISGIKYVTSSGDASKIASAKNTLMYSIVGLIVAIASYAIVEFVLSKL